MSRLGNKVPGVFAQKSGTIVGRPAHSGQGQATQMSLAQLVAQLPGAGMPPPSAGGRLAAIADKNLLANISGVSALPIGIGYSAFLDYVLGSTAATFALRGSASWIATALSGDATLSSSGVMTIANNAVTTAKLAAGAVTYAKVQNGASAGLLGVNNGAPPSEVAIGAGLTLSGGTLSASGGSYADKGTWSGNSAYSPSDVALYNGSRYLCWKSVSAPGGAPLSLDGAGISGAIGSGATTKSLSLTTSNTNDLVIVVVASSLHQLSAQATNHVTSVTATGLTFTKRTSYNNRVAGSYDANIEIWTAPATAALSAVSITTTMNVAVDTGVIGIFAVTGTNTGSPFDGNISLPATTGADTLTISTTAAKVFVPFICYTNSAGVALEGTPTGFTNIFADIHDGSGLGNSDCLIAYEITAAALSSVTFGSNTPTTKGPYLVMDGDDQISITPNLAPDQDPAHWLSQGNIRAPCGRLSLSSTAAAQTADVVGGMTVYYLPYQGVGTCFLGLDLPTAGVSLTLDSNSLHTGYQQSGKLFDLFLYNNTGTLVLGTGPAWTSNTARSAAIDQTTIPGWWSNTATMTLKTDATSGTISAAAGSCLYVGTMYASANGQCTCQFNPAAVPGGNNTIMGLFNAYNLLKCSVSSSDSTSSWTYATNTWRNVNASASNRISWVDGLAIVGICAQYICNLQTGTSNVANIGIGINTSGTTLPVCGSQTASVAGEVSSLTINSSGPILGFNFVQAQEDVVIVSGSVTFSGLTGPGMDLMRLEAHLLY